MVLWSDELLLHRELLSLNGSTFKALEEEHDDVHLFTVTRSH